MHFLNFETEKNECNDADSDVFNETDWRREFDGQVFLSHFKSTSAGVALLFFKRLLTCITCGGGAGKV